MTRERYAFVDRYPEAPDSVPEGRFCVQPAQYGPAADKGGAYVYAYDGSKVVTGWTSAAGTADLARALAEIAGLRIEEPAPAVEEPTPRFRSGDRLVVNASRGDYAVRKGATATAVEDSAPVPAEESFWHEGTSEVVRVEWDRTPEHRGQGDGRYEADLFDLVPPAPEEPEPEDQDDAPEDDGVDLVPYAVGDLVSVICPSGWRAGDGEIESVDSDSAIVRFADGQTQRHPLSEIARRAAPTPESRWRPVRVNIDGDSFGPGNSWGFKPEQVAHVSDAPAEEEPEPEPTPEPDPAPYPFEVGDVALVLSDPRYDGGDAPNEDFTPAGSIVKVLGTTRYFPDDLRVEILAGPRNVGAKVAIEPFSLAPLQPRDIVEEPAAVEEAPLAVGDRVRIEHSDYVSVAPVGSVGTIHEEYRPAGAQLFGVVIDGDESDFAWTFRPDEIVRA